MNNLEIIKSEFDKAIAGVDNLQKYNDVRVAFTGKKGKISEAVNLLRELPVEQKREFGQKLNEVKTYVEEGLSKKELELNNLKVNAELSKNSFDVTLPVDPAVGSLHVRTSVLKEIEDVFISMGFVVEDGNEIETEYNNFDSVNVPVSHPARDMQDTFWLDNGELLKTQTSASQNRIMLKYGAPCKVIYPGRCFRNESLDAKHENTFFQLEGVVIDKNISISNLTYFVKSALCGVFKNEVEVRLRPGFFPFVEPGFELDAKCPFCGGKGCSTCKGSGWLELCPCGMIHPNVLRMGGIDPEVYSGFAFGLGCDRLAMIKGGYKDIRVLNSGNLKILSQMGL